MISKGDGQIMVGGTEQNVGIMVRSLQVQFPSHLICRCRVFALLRPTNKKFKLDDANVLQSFPNLHISQSEDADCLQVLVAEETWLGKAQQNRSVAD